MIGREMYDHVLATLVVRKGYLTRGESWFWGAAHADDYLEGRKHLQECGWRCLAVDEDYEWSEFAGTFAEGDNKRHGIKISVSCECGQITKRGMLYENGVGSAIRDVLELADIMSDLKTKSAE
jgi:hypothetical protein